MDDEGAFGMKAFAATQRRQRRLGPSRDAIRPDDLARPELGDEIG
jgi:hypothetical protein